MPKRRASARRVRATRSTPRNARRPTSRRTRPKVSSPATGFGTVVAKGIRQLTTFIPGQPIVRPVVDFIYRALGLSTDFTIGQESKISGTFAVLGLTARLFIKPQMLLSESRNIGLQSITQGKIQTKINFRTAVFRYIKFTLTPVGKRSDCKGMVAMAYLPLQTVDSVSTYTDARWASFENVSQMAGSIYGYAGRPLNLKWTNRGQDGFSSLPQDLYLNNTCGVLFIAFNDENRETYTDISPSEFASQVTISCTANMGSHETADFGTAGSVTLSPELVTPASEYQVAFSGSTYVFDKTAHAAQFAQSNKKIMIRDVPVKAHSLSAEMDFENY